MFGDVLPVHCRMKVSAFLLALILAMATHAETITGRVVSIEGHACRMDAPERKQPFGTRSRQWLAALCFNKEAQLETAGKDRNGRTIATVHCAGINANAEQIRQGLAWRSVQILGRQLRRLSAWVTCRRS